MKFLPVYTASFFFTLHYALTLYINSTYLSQFFSKHVVSSLFIAGSLLSIFLLISIPKLLRKYDLRRLLIIFLLINFIAISGLIVSTTPFGILLAFLLFGSVPFSIYYLFDIYIENLSVDKKTGSIRGIFLTIINASIASAPLILAVLVVGDELKPVYALSLLMLLPVFVLAIGSFKWQRRITGESFTSHHFNDFIIPVRKWWYADDIRRVSIARFILEVFYTIMIIFTPLYLNKAIGFNWSEIGIIFSIMLLPFILFEWPVGELADRWFGEKEFMTVGFFMTGTSLLFMPFLGKTIFLWATILFLSRVGASFIEVTTESYFFKQVTSRDRSLINIFRLVRPSAIIIGTLLGSLSVAIFPYSVIFFTLAIAVFLGMRESVAIKDTL